MTFGTYGPGVDRIILNNEAGIIKIEYSSNISSGHYDKFPRGERNIELNYNVGWDELPADVNEAIIYLTSEAILGHEAGMTGWWSISQYRRILKKLRSNG